MQVKLGKYKLKVWFIILMSLYLHSIMFNQYRLLTYVYVYLLPLLYLLINANKAIHEISKLKKGNLSLFLFFFCFILAGAIISPIVNKSFDFSFITIGPIKQIVIRAVINLFLIVLYKNKFAASFSSVEYSLYVVFANVFYVFGTLVICAFPSLHEFIIDNIYMSELTRSTARESYYYTRIGWSGYSSFIQAAECAISVVLCVLFALCSKKKEVFIKSNILFLILTIGCFCYARTGVIAAAACIFLYLYYLIIKGDIKVLTYPFVFFSMIIVLVYLINNNEGIKNWYNWAFAQVISFRKTGSFETATITSLFDMYKTLPNGLSWIFGDGQYTSQTGLFYKSVDIGWYRSVFYYGLVFSFFQYAALVVLIHYFSKNAEKRIGRAAGRIVFFMLIIIFIVFESKGEVWYILINSLLPICFLQIDDNLKLRTT